MYLLIGITSVTTFQADSCRVRSQDLQANSRRYTNKKFVPKGKNSLTFGCGQIPSVLWIGLGCNTRLRRRAHPSVPLSRISEAIIRGLSDGGHRLIALGISAS